MIIPMNVEYTCQSDSFQHESVPSFAKAQSQTVYFVAASQSVYFLGCLVWLRAFHFSSIVQRVPSASSATKGQPPFSATQSDLVPTRTASGTCLGGLFAKNF